jgi:hypothetical protein
MKIFVSTILGSPAAECANFGICQMDVLPPEDWDGFQPKHARHVKALLSLQGEGSKLCFEFPFLSMRVDTRKAFFTPDGFRVDSTGYLSDALSGMLHAESRFIVPKLYPLVFLTESVILEVELMKQVIENVPAKLDNYFANGSHINSANEPNSLKTTNTETARR